MLTATLETSRTPAGGRPVIEHRLRVEGDAPTRTLDAVLDAGRAVVLAHWARRGHAPDWVDLRAEATGPGAWRVTARVPAP